MIAVHGVVIRIHVLSERNVYQASGDFPRTGYKKDRL